MSNHKRIVHVAGAMVLGSLLGLSSVGLAQEEGVVISIGEAVDPPVAEVAIGETLTFRNDDGEPHQLVSDVDRIVFDTGVLEPGAVFEVTFGLPGEYPFLDVLGEGDPAYAGLVVVTTEAEPSDGLDSLPGGVEAAIAEFAFSPDPLEITAGTTVTWTNVDPVAHTVTATEGAFASDVLLADSSFSETFDEAGTFAYFCSIHPVMTGTVVVSGVGG